MTSLISPPTSGELTTRGQSSGKPLTSADALGLRLRALRSGHPVADSRPEVEQQPVVSRSERSHGARTFVTGFPHSQGGETTHGQEDAAAGKRGPAVTISLHGGSVHVFMTPTLSDERQVVSDGKF